MAISLTKPDIGSTGWGTNVNNNFTTIENALNNLSSQTTGSVYVTSAGWYNIAEVGSGSAPANGTFTISTLQGNRLVFTLDLNDYDDVTPPSSGAINFVLLSNIGGQVSQIRIRWVNADDTLYVDAYTVGDGDFTCVINSESNFVVQQWTTPSGTTSWSQTYDISNLQFDVKDYLKVGTSGITAATVAEDGWVGIGSSSERIVFDGSADEIKIQDAGLNVAGKLCLTGIISPSQITSNQNDYNPTGLSTCNVMRLSSSASYQITGLAAQSSGTVIVVVNVGSYRITLKTENASSSAGNRFGTAADCALDGKDAAMLWYDNSSSRWRILGMFT